METLNEHLDEYSNQFTSIIDKIENIIQKNTNNDRSYKNSDLSEALEELKTVLGKLQNNQNMPWFRNYRISPNDRMQHLNVHELSIKDALPCCVYAHKICTNMIQMLYVNIENRNAYAKMWDKNLMELKKKMELLDDDEKWFKNPLIHFYKISEKVYNNLSDWY